MSRGGGASGPGWGWWPPSRRRNPREREREQQQQQQRGRRRGGGSPEGGRAWAFPAAAAAAAAASLSLLVLLLGLSGAALSLAVAAAAAGGAWAASSSSAGGGGRGKETKGPPSLPHRAFSPAVANGGPAMGAGCCFASPGPALPERKRRQLQQQQQHQRGSCGDHLSASPHFMISPRRRYPIQQAQYTSLGTLPSICWDGYRRKSRLSVHNSSLARSPVTVKIARPDSNLYRSPLLEQLVSPVAFSATPNSTLDPCAKETVLSALRESRKRAVEEEEEEGEEDQNVPSGQESKRRRHDSSGSGQSAFEPLVANGAPASLVPKPGSLKRCLLSHCLEEGSSKRSRTSSLSSVNSLPVGGIPSSIRNAIASSYSSTRGLSQLWKRSGPSTSPLSSPASSRSQTPERPNKKARYPNTSLTDDESHQLNSSTPVRADKEAPAEKTKEMPLQSRHSSPASPPSSGNTGKRKRKIQLVSIRRDDNFTMPLPPQLGYPVTSADLDAEKKAALQWFNRVLEDKTDSTPNLSVPMNSPPSTLSFGAEPNKSTTVSLAVTAASTNPLLESLKKMQDGQSPTGQAGAGSAAETSPLAAPSPSLDLGSSMPMSSPEVAKAPLLSLGVPASLATTVLSSSSSTAQPASSTCSPMAASSSEQSQTPARPASAPKPSTLFGILTSPLAAPVSTTTASTAPEAAPVFKPIFGSPAKSEGLGFSTSSTTTTGLALATGTLSSSSLATPPVTSSSTFKPIFGAPPPPATSALSATVATASPFTFQPAPVPILPTSSSNTAASPGFAIPLETTVTTTTAAALLSTTANTTAVSSNKAVFGFGSTMPASTAAPSSTSAAAPASSQHPSLFGAPSSSSTAPLFQFGKPSAPTATLSPLVSSAFSQTPSCNTETALSTTATTAGFSLFGSSSTTTAASTTAQSHLTFGSATSAFTGGFGMASKPPPPYPTDTSQLALDTTATDSQQAPTKPSAGPVSFGTPFNFSQPAAQPAFGSTSQTPFGGPGPLPSFGAKSNTQPAFGATTSVFSFGTATTSATAGFGANTQTTSSNSSAGGSVFGSSAPPPFSFGAANQPPGTVNAFGMGAAAAAGTAAPGPAPVGFSFGSGPSGAAGAVPTPFGSSLAQNPLGAQSQSSGFAFSIPGTQESKPAFGGAPPPAFGQSSPAPGVGTVGGSTLSFGTPITPTFGSAGPAFGPSAATFSIGAGSKTSSRQRLQARRQHPRKK